ncbi:MAG: amidohydrolase family protein [Planctomycetes bacterium]|nr:amidohydrolase family protein [Planctomycetota bacterium]
MKIFREEIDDFLPQKILDFHVHVFPEEIMPPDHEGWSAGGHRIRSYTLDELRQDLADLYPGRECRAVCFGTPHEELDSIANNEYVAEKCDHKRFFPLRLIRPEDDPDAVRKDVLGKKFLGFKPYRNYVRKADPEEVEVFDMLPDELMAIADELGLIVMLHIPRKQRLADPKNQGQVVALAERFPHATIVLAHIGRAYYLKNIVGHLGDLAPLPNVYFDIAMLNHWEVLEYLFANVESHKILYGTDLPIGIAPGKSVEINNQYTYVTPAPWELSISDDHDKLVFTAFTYEELRAIRKAVERLGLSKQFVEDVFFHNGMRLIEQVDARIGGGD